MESLLARKKSSSTLSRKRSASGSASLATPGDQRPREKKTAPYRNPRYKNVLGTKGSFMVKVLPREASKTVTQTLPHIYLFCDDILESTCRKVADRNEVGVIRDLSLLVVPSSELTATHGATELDYLIESMNEGWNHFRSLFHARHTF
ncbi:hypothetical protein BDP81DRAFT_110731 [Colletotrichum phormii]|uniref:DUF7924 domain-containing protein n=1 Tax=Colletotrichum phormii TaxID=359342 RepID=A0AAI9ZH91_9PEZI|nr:uncharacterized protein BDP81DRAFT_110731 [Colletotrichum phormii]KAK1624563.1 hypothetical protein BDP81DRAFT_110731 [Colletotrichum phormii]